MPRRTPSRQKKAKKRPALLYLSLAAAILLIALLVLMKPKKGPGEPKFSDLRAKPLIGSTVEERLSQHMDLTNAAITKITNAAALRDQYSGIFRDAQDGQYLVELPDSIIIYDFEHDEIVSRFEYRRITLE